MNIILDTHIFLWLLFEPKKISEDHMRCLEDLGNNLFLSSISLAEIMIKKSLNKLDVDFDLDITLKRTGINILDFDAKSALLLMGLPYHHRDPFDRMIIVQAISGGHKILTVDEKFKCYECDLL